MMYKIAITGNIATGKTTVSKILINLGYKVFESDKEVKKTYEMREVVKQIKEIFNNKIPDLVKQNKINTNNLGNYVFSKKTELKKLEEVIYPYIRKHKILFVKKYSKEKVLFFDVPLLFEKKLQEEYDFIFYTRVDSETQKSRVMKRANMNTKKFEKILMNQISLPKKFRTKVTLDLDTSETKTQIKKIITTFLKRKGL